MKFATPLLWSLVSLVSLLAPATALKFDLNAVSREQLDAFMYSHGGNMYIARSRSGPGRRCFSMWIDNDELVTGHYDVSPGPHMAVDVEITDHQGSILHQKKDIQKMHQFAFSTPKSSMISDYSICFNNTLSPGVEPNYQMRRSVEFEIRMGAEAVVDADAARNDKLQPIEIELRKIEHSIQSVVDQMEMLKQGEASMRDTNESTNERVLYFSVGSIAVLIAVGVWQIYYLRVYFQSKKLI